MLKRIVSLLLAFTLAFSTMSVAAAETASTSSDSATISVNTQYVEDGGTVNVDISIANNPGILGTDLTVTYAEGLTLTAAAAGSAFSYLTMTKPGQFSSPCKFNWDGQEVKAGSVKDGVILTLTFTVAEGIEAGTELPVSVAVGDTYDNDLNAVDVQTVDGKVKVVNFTPGDLNADGSVNITDLVLTRRYIVGGYNISIMEQAADVNNDGKINSADAILMRRYIAGGYNVELKYSSWPCIHSLTATAYKAATCTEDGNNAYWYCSKCNKYFSDSKGLNEISLSDTVINALGHTIVAIPAVKPTLFKTGTTEGAMCSVCGLVTVEPQPWKLNEYTVTYDISNGDDYLASLTIENPNAATVKETDTLYLEDLEVPGYQFIGWSLSSTDQTNLVTKVEDVSRNVKLYAQWKAISYNVSFEYDTELAGKIATDKLENVTYTVNKTTTLPIVALSGYTFIGWSDESGTICTKINPGSTGDKVYYANWISDRNKAWSKNTLSDPIIYDDEEDNVILFAYEIGKIENVPLDVIEDFGKITSGGVTKTVEKEYSVTTSESCMESYTSAVEKATTDTHNWTLSDGWNETVSVSEEWCEQNGYTLEEAEEMSKSETGNWYVSNSEGGSHTDNTSDVTDTYNLSTKTNNTTTYNSKDTTTYDSKTKTAGYELNANFTHSNETGEELSAGLSVGIEGVGANIGGKVTDTTTNTLSIGGSYENKTATKSGTDTTEKSGSDTVEGGSEQTGTVSTHTHDSVDTSSWNTESGYSSSSTTSSSSSVARALSEMISSTTGYGKSYIKNGESSSTSGTSSTSGSAEEYGSTVTYSTVTSEATTVSYTTSNTMEGYHRWITAGTAHVFGVVGYDMATKSYFTYSYTIMDDETHPFEDYSYKTASYDDNQSSIVKFEIPDEITDYVAAKTWETNGLEYDLNGNVTAYKGEDSLVIIPEYGRADNLDNTYTVVKVTGIAENAFRGNTNITGVVLSDYITNIPDNAFEGCTELYGICGAGVTSIGANAFSGCEKLWSFKLSSMVTELGDNAFDSTDFLEVDAANSAVVTGAVNSGATQIVIGLANMTDSLDNTELNIPDKDVDGNSLFVLRGYDKEYSNLVINSNADITIINRLTINSDGAIPLKLYSPIVNLCQTTVNSTGIGLVLHADNTDLGLYGQVNVNGGVNSMLCKSATLSQIATGLDTSLNVTGKVLTCGTITDEASLLKGTIETVDADTWTNRLNSYTLTFDAAGGTCSTTSMKVANATAIGTMPTPTRNGFGFDGWYTADGEKVTAESVFSTGLDMTVYAHWNANQYTATWSAGTGTTIVVNRTSSPYANAGTGTLSSGAAIYYGDVLSITYGAQTGFTLATKGSTSITVTGNVTSSNIYATANPNSYTASWNTGTGYTITVKRTSSPYKNAGTGTLSSGAAVYYGDVLSITYSASTGYTVSGHGSTSITVTGNVTSSNIYASASANSYTYTILYRSTNGTDLGSSSATYKYGTTNTISAPAKSNYNTPGSQSVAWDSTSAKTITFYYSPVSRSTSQQMASGTCNTWTSSSGRSYGVSYVAYAEYQNRTASSVQVRIHWVQTITANCYFGYPQYFSGTINGSGTGTITICSASTWSSQTSYARSVDAYSGWITCGVSATQSSVGVSASYWDSDGGSTSWSNSITIPTY